MLFKSTEEYFKQRIYITNIMSQHSMLCRLLASIDIGGTIHISRVVTKQMLTITNSSKLIIKAIYS